MSSKWMGNRWMLLAIAGAIAAMLFLYGRGVWMDEESKLITDLDRMASAGGTGEYISKFDFICFNYDNRGFRAEFEQAAAKKGIDISESLRSCGHQQSCCAQHSDVGGIIGLIESGIIRCVDISGAPFLVDGDSGLCAKPSELRVQREIFTRRFHPPGSPWSANPGQTYYKISHGIRAPS
jgi:hypothetical protein